MFYETLLTIKGSYTQALYLVDPEVIEIQASAPDKDWEPGSPPLFGFTAEIEAMYHVADQVQASRIQKSEDFKPYPRPVIPAEKVRRRRKESKQGSGIEDALQRGRDAAKWNYL